MVTANPSTVVSALMRTSVFFSIQIFNLEGIPGIRISYTEHDFPLTFSVFSG